MRWLAVAVFVLAPGCVEPEPDPQETWWSVDVIQCQMNPWDQRVEPNEAQRIRSHYEAQGVTIQRIEFRTVYEAVCEACHCPRGDRAYASLQEGAETGPLEQDGWAESPGPAAKA